MSDPAEHRTSIGSAACRDLACPEDKGPLLYFVDESALYNPRLRRRYPIREGIPVMLIDEAESIAEDSEHDRSWSRPRPTASSRPSNRADAPLGRHTWTPDEPVMTADLEIFDSPDMWPAPRSRWPNRSKPRRAAAAVENLPDPTGVNAVVVMGMGGSGIGNRGGSRGCPRPACPCWFRRTTSNPAGSAWTRWCWLRSFSGIDRGDYRCGPAHEAGARMVVMASGGSLVELAAEWGIPVVPLVSIPMPCRNRCGLGHSSGAARTHGVRVGDHRAGSLGDGGSTRRRMTSLAVGVPGADEGSGDRVPVDPPPSSPEDRADDTAGVRRGSAG
ncbi:MAG: Trm112 family protein [Microthrixaceae bacterium]